MITQKYIEILIDVIDDQRKVMEDFKTKQTFHDYELGKKCKELDGLNKRLDYFFSLYPDIKETWEEVNNNYDLLIQKAFEEE